MKNKDQLVTQKELAQEMKVSIAVINNWIRRGKLQAVTKYGKTLVVRSSAKKLVTK